MAVAAALPPLALIGYSLWRVGEQVIGGLDPNFTANAWGGPSYLGAMACHYLDATLMIAVGAWLLDKILPSTTMVSNWLHHVHVWLDADTWHWAMLEIDGAVLLIVFICCIAAAFRGDGVAATVTPRQWLTSATGQCLT